MPVCRSNFRCILPLSPFGFIGFIGFLYAAQLSHAQDQPGGTDEILDSEPKTAEVDPVPLPTKEEGEKEPEDARSDDEGSLYDNPIYVENILKDAQKWVTGEGLPKNHKRAFKEYYEIASRGNITARYYLAQCYMEGIGTAREVGKANTILKKLAEEIVSKQPDLISPTRNPITRQVYRDYRKIKPATIHLPYFRTTYGEKLDKPKVLKMDEKGMRIMHSGGVSTVSWKMIPADIKIRAGYDVTNLALQEAIRKAQYKNLKK